MHNPLVRWGLILFAVILFAAPLLAADIALAIISGIQTAIDSLETFGEKVTPK